MKMLARLNTIRKRLLPDKRMLEMRQQTGTSVLTEIRLHNSLHRLLDQQLRCRTLRKPLE